VNRAADAGDDEQHHQAQRVELEAEINVQAADGQPVDGSFTRMKAVGVDENEREMKPMTIAPMEMRLLTFCDAA
jgi:hypothetical protein